MTGLACRTDERADSSTEVILSGGEPGPQGFGLEPCSVGGLAVRDTDPPHRGPKVGGSVGLFRQTSPGSWCVPQLRVDRAGGASPHFPSPMLSASQLLPGARDLAWGSLTTLWSEGKGSMSCSAIEYSESLATAQAPSPSCLLTAPTQSPTKESWGVTPRPRHPQVLEQPPL